MPYIYIINYINKEITNKNELYYLNKINRNKNIIKNNIKKNKNVFSTKDM